MAEPVNPRYQLDGPSSDAVHEPILYQPRQIIDPAPGLGMVNDSLVEQYQQLGFLSIANVFSLEQVDAARVALADLIMGHQPAFEGLQFEASAAAKLDELTLAEREVAVRKLMGFTRWDDRLRALAEHEPLLALVQRLLRDRQPTMFQDMALLKPPGGREKPWHQDKAYFAIAADEPVVGVWIALDEATPNNGCMHLIPGSHRQGPVVHFKRRDWQICDSEVGRDQVAAPLEPGGVLLFDGLMHHGTPRNPTGERRRALQFHYAAADAVWTDKEAHLALFGSEGRDVTC